MTFTPGRRLRADRARGREDARGRRRRHGHVQLQQVDRGLRPGVVRATASTAATRCTCRPRTRSSRRTTARSRTSSRTSSTREFKAEFDAAGLTYEHRLIDDMVAAAMKWEGGYVWACKNYDGDVQSDTVAQGFGSLGLMTSRAHDARRQDGGGGGRARHRDAPLPPAPSRASPRRPTRSRRSSRGPGGLKHRGKLDGTPEVTGFAETLEDVVIKTVEDGQDDQGPRARSSAPTRRG